MSNTILYFISSLFEIYTLGIYSGQLFLPRHSKHTRIILLSIFCLVLFVVCLFQNAWLNITAFACILGIYMFSQYQTTWYICLFHTFLLTSLDAITEMVVFGIINFYFPDNIPSLTNTTAHFVLVLFSKPLYLFIVQMIAQVLHNKQQASQSFVKSDFLLFPIPLISICITLAFTYCNKINWLISICASGLLLLNLLVFGINQYNQKRQEEYTQMQLLCQKESDMAEYYHTLVEQQENQHILIHDIRRHLSSIDTLALAEENDKIHTYIRQLQDSFSLKESLHYSDVPLLNAILCRYTHQCELQHISFLTDIRRHTVDFLTDVDLTSLFCNLLDNALRAASFPDGFIELHTYNKECSPFAIITLVNSCRKNPFTGSENIPVSTKDHPQKHGFGLKSVQRIADRYDGEMKLYFDLSTLTFHTILMLRSPK